VPDDYDFEGYAHLNADGEVIFDFGQYRGEPVTIVSTPYLKWLLNEGFPEDLGTAVAEELKARGEM